MSRSSSTRQPLSDVQLKKSTVKFYENSFLDIILRNVLHPGGLKLTEQLAVLADIDEKSMVLDIASGRGVSAIFLAKKFNCKVVGVDLSEGMAKKAADSTEAEKVSERVVFGVGDAEKLFFRSGAFDTVISECALCLFPAKKRALSEMYRVLKEGGRIALSDVTLDKTLREIRNNLSFLSCIAGAESLGALQSLLEEAGFVEVTAIDASQVVVDLYKLMKRQSSLLTPLLKTAEDSCGCLDLKKIEEFGQTAERLVLAGKLGYGVLIGRKSSSTLSGAHVD